ncbi:hypothetical protein G6F24_015460 [Rhizopus arrhizus]|nr:hypothetical protein G6F24_015460 [Rhizopus arrhizus]
MDTLSQHVTDTLRDWVLHGQFSPGARLEEIPLAEKLGVSRTPVRAALATLGNEGLLEHLPKRGYTVRAYDIGEIVAAYEQRRGGGIEELPGRGRPDPGERGAAGRGPFALPEGEHHLAQRHPRGGGQPVGQALRHAVAGHPLCVGPHHPVGRPRHHPALAR